MRELVSGSATGEVKLWDIRMDNPVRGFLAHTKGTRGLSIHEHAPITATYNSPANSHPFRYISVFVMIISWVSYMVEAYLIDGCGEVLLLLWGVPY